MAARPAAMKTNVETNGCGVVLPGNTPMPKTPIP
jgi:hypothetical protein